MENFTTVYSILVVVGQLYYCVQQPLNQEAILLNSVQYSLSGATFLQSRIESTVFVKGQTCNSVQ